VELSERVKDYGNDEQIGTYRRGRKCYVEREREEREREREIFEPTGKMRELTRRGCRDISESGLELSNL
jgi:hypothetical protein